MSRTDWRGGKAEELRALAAAAAKAVKALCELRRTACRDALTTMCIGGGQGIAAIFERI
jgi:acetyl-CoA C-acetyltransferase